MEDNADAIGALTEIAGKKVDKVDGKGLSTNDYTTEEKNKLAGIAPGAEVNVQSDWNATSGDAMILNKPAIPTVPTNVSAFTNDANYAKVDEIPTKTSQLTNDSGYLTTHQDISGKVDKVDGKGLSTNDYTTEEKNKLAGIAAGAEVNVQSDWNATEGDALILNKPELTKVINITIPAGRMRGDVNGDGIFSMADDDVMRESYYYKATDPNDINSVASDINADGSVNASDKNDLTDLRTKDHKAGQYAEITGNWICNPNYATEEAQFYTDIVVDGITPHSNAMINVTGTTIPDLFVEAECLDGKIRLWVKLCPVADLPALVIYSEADGEGVATITTGSFSMDEYLSIKGGTCEGELTLSKYLNFLATDGTEAAHLGIGAQSRLLVYAENGVTFAKSQLKSVADPTDAQDAATKNYVDTSLANFTSGTQVQLITWEAND